MERGEWVKSQWPIQYCGKGFARGSGDRSPPAGSRGGALVGGLGEAEAFH